MDFCKCTFCEPYRRPESLKWNFKRTLLVNFYRTTYLHKQAL